MDPKPTQLQVYNRNGDSVSQMKFSQRWMDFEPRPHLVHDYVVAYNHNQRQWSACTKTRADVKATGKKPWRQKGTGRARAGSLITAQFRGGGVVFGPKPKNIRTKVNKKVKELAFKSVLHQRIFSDSLMVVDQITMDQPRTKEIIEMLGKLNIAGKVLVVLSENDPNVVLSMRNIPNLTIRNIENLNAYDLVSHRKLLFTAGSVSQLGIFQESAEAKQ
jgi:large subunit ribosomal protein L4